MISLDKEQTCLLELIKASLFGVTPVITEGVKWKKVFELSKAQCIVPLVASVVPEEHRSDWLGISCQSKARFIQLLYEQNTLVNLLRSNDIPFVILKGTAAAIYYPAPTTRTFGDIDIYLLAEKCDSAMKIIKENGYIVVSNDSRHYEFEKNGIGFDIHTRFSCQYYKDVDHIILNGLNNAVEYRIISNVFPGLPTIENGLVLLGHIMQHLKDSGIGLRQIIDWMLFVHKALDDSAWYSCFRPLAREAGLEKLAITVSYMCKKWIGLPDEISWCDGADEVVAEQLLIRIFEDGNFGLSRAPFEKVNFALRDKSVFAYLQRVGLINWSLAQKYSILRPFAWLYQLCRFVIKGIAGLFTGKKVFKKNKLNMSLEELWERLE